MSYQAIVPSQDVFSGIDFDNDFDFTGQTPTHVAGLQVGTMDPQIHAFVNDHPFDASKKSYRVTGFGGGAIQTSNIRAGYNGVDAFGVSQNTALTGGGRNTFEFWFKYTTLNNRVPQFANNGVIAQIFSNDSSLERQAIEVRLIGGGTFGTGGAGTLSMAFISSGSTLTARTGAFYYSPNVWHCVHVEFQRDNSTLKNRPYLYVNGAFDNCASSILGTTALYSDNFSSIRLGPPTNQLSSTLTDGTQLFLAEATYFRRNLTNKEKMLRAQYGRMTTAGLRNEILADNPKIYLPADNETQFPIEQAGDPTWGTQILSTWSEGQTNGRATYGGSFNVNQTGDRGKAWSWQIARNNELKISGNTARKLKDLLHDRTKSITMEWFTLNPTYDSSLATNGGQPWIQVGRDPNDNVTTGNGGFRVQNTSNNGSTSATSFIGRQSTTFDAWSGTAWVQYSALFDFLGPNKVSPISGNSQMNFSNYADNQWHHHAFVLSRTANGIEAVVYFDGFAYGKRTLPAVANSINYTDVADWANFNIRRFAIGTNNLNSGTPINRNLVIDNISIYDYALSDERIKQHYYAFSAQDPVPNTRVVRHWTGTEWVDSLDQKVWNGTAWVDWDAKRWDGTSWIAA
jgi:hypothetical protein